MDIFQSTLQMFGGLAIFIYGVHLLSEGLERVAGARFLSLLEKSTNNRFKGAVFGMVATALMQSSGLLMVTMIGLINANLLNLTQAIGVMLGQEIGTTITGQLVAFHVRGFNLIFLVIGFYLIFFSKSAKLKAAGQPLFGFGIVFLGMTMMADSGAVVSKLPVFQQTLEFLSSNLFLAVIAGAVLTAAIQSSTAMTGLVIAMGKSNSITLAVAIGIILGANIGSCIMGWLASLQSTTSAKRASYAQIFMNIGGVLLFLPFIVPYTDLVSKTAGDLARQIANAHTIFNVIVSALFFPLVKPLATFVEKLIPEKETEDQKSKKTHFIDERLLSTPVVAVQLAKEEVLLMGWLTHEMIEKSGEGMLDGKSDIVKWVLKREKDVDSISHELGNFLEQIPGEKLSEHEHETLEDLKHLITDIERVGDHATNLAEFARKMEHDKIKFSKYAVKELRELFSHVVHNYGVSLKSLKSGSEKQVHKVIEEEDLIDHLEKTFKRNHEKRSKARICQPEADTIFIETLRNLERVSDHAYNIALSNVDS